MGQEMMRALVITQEKDKKVCMMTLSAFIYIHYHDKDYSKTFALLSKLKKLEKSDIYLSNLMSSCIYKFITLKREQTSEIKKLIKISAEKASQIISKKDQQNSSAAILLGNLLAERGKLLEAKVIFDKILNHQKVGIYNSAFLEFLTRENGKALTILQSPQSEMDWKRKTFYAIILVLNKRFRDGEKKMKYRLLRNPSKKNYFNLGSIIHEKVKRTFSKRTAHFKEMKKLVKQLDWVQKMFNSMFKGISNESIISVESTLDAGEVKRMKLKNLKQLLKDQVFYIRENRENYVDVIEEEEQKTMKQKTSLMERRKLVEEKKEQEKQRAEQVRNRKEEEKRKRELKALQLQNEMAGREDELLMMFENKKNKTRSKKTTIKDEDISFENPEETGKPKVPKKRNLVFLRFYKI